VAELARRQHGVVSGAQLRTLGLGRGALQRGLEARRLLPVHRGVYAVGHARLTARGWFWAAVLACGGPEAAVLSHRSAASVWELLPTPSGAVEVTTLRDSASKPGVRVHESATLDRVADVWRDPDGLATTTVTRTLIDLADVLSAQRLRRAVHRAEILRLLDAGALRARLEVVPGRRTRALEAIVAELAAREPEITRSELEHRFLALVDQFGLPRPRVNAVIVGLEVDFLWPDGRLIAETDGAATHLTPSAFEEDRRRDAALAVAGYRVVRFTRRRVVQQPQAVAATLRALLAR
jgi:very-short-patch-repair endonuclease